MGEHFNQLTAAEAERLALLAEECGEVIQVVGKILRHGYRSCHPDNLKVTNRQLLEKELGDLAAARNMMEMARDVDQDSVVRAALAKIKKVEKYLHHQCELATQDTIQPRGEGK